MKAIAIGDLERATDTTRRMLERVPEKHCSWKPHAKSWSLGEPATHLTHLLYWPIGILRHDEFDLATVPSSRSIPERRDALLRTFEKNAAALIDALDRADETALRRTWQLKRGDDVILPRPSTAVKRAVESPGEEGCRSGRQNGSIPAFDNQ